METEQLVRSLAATLRPVRRLRPARWRAVLWAVPAVLCVSIGAVLLGPRSDLLSRAANPQFWLQNALLLFVSASSAAIAFQTSVPGSEVAGHVRALPLWGLLVWGFVLAGGAWAWESRGAAGMGGAGWTCVSRIALLGAVPAVFALLMLRRAAALRPGWTGAIALVSAASLAVVGMQMVCAKDDPRHLFVWHFLPAAACGLAGVLLGRRFLVTSRSGV
jgi:hypothetical protein